MMHYLKITDWKTLQDFLEDTVSSKRSRSDYFHFRGQSVFEWKLEPTLMRIVKGDPTSESKAEYYEKMTEFEFRSQFHLSNEGLSYQNDTPFTHLMVDMQHYSCPTRLLDWSHSPYVGLYFSINENFNSNGALYMWDYRIYNNKLETLNPGYKDIHPNELLKIKHYDFVTIIMAIRKNQRIAKQQGCFTYSNSLIKAHCDMILSIFEKNEPSGLIKLEIPFELKFEFLERLKLMNISAGSLFPGLDGLGRSIKETLLLRRWSGG